MVGFSWVYAYFPEYYISYITHHTAAKYIGTDIIQ